jgi:hypothetical protein
VRSRLKSSTVIYMIAWGWSHSVEEGWEAAPWSVETDRYGLRIKGSDAVAQHAVGGGGGEGGRTRGAEGGGSPPEGSGAAGVVGWDARLKTPRRRGRDQRGADGVIELALEQGVGGRFQGSSPAVTCTCTTGARSLRACPGTRRSRCR